MQEKEKLPEQSGGTDMLREYVVNSFLKKGIRVTIPNLIERYAEINPQYAEELAMVLGFPEYSDR